MTADQYQIIKAELDAAWQEFTATDGIEPIIDRWRLDGSGLILDLLRCSFEVGYAHGATNAYAEKVKT